MSRESVDIHEYPELKQVVTLAQAARMIPCDPSTVRYAIDHGLVAAVRCGRIWLVSVPSMRRRWKIPG